MESEVGRECIIELLPVVVALFTIGTYVLTRISKLECTVFVEIDPYGRSCLVTGVGSE